METHRNQNCNEENINQFNSGLEVLGQHFTYDYLIGARKWDLGDKHGRIYTAA